MTLADHISARAKELYEALREHGDTAWEDLESGTKIYWEAKASRELSARHTVTLYAPVPDRNPKLPGVYVLDALEDGAQRPPEGRFAPRARFRDQEHPDRTMSMPTSEWVEAGRPTVIEVHL